MSIPRCYARAVSSILRDSSQCRRGVSMASRTPDSESARYNLKNTSPSSSKPSVIPRGVEGGNEGYLAFTKASLYKLTLPLSSPANDPTSPASKSSSDSAQRYKSDSSSNSSTGAVNGTADKDSEAWEQQVESGKPQGHLSQTGDNADEEKAESKGPRSVVFLLHSGQPLSYIAGLIRSEGPDVEPASQSSEHDKYTRPRDSTGDPPITFHTTPNINKRWSPSTGIGDFLREAARVGSFTISIGARRVDVNVPSFEERTRFLRASLHAKTEYIERLARVKGKCDHIARQATQRVAFAGAGIMGTWWVTVGVLTFNTDLGWDTMEPITYLTGFGTVISGYLWFLWHNREVSYRTVLTETTSRRQQKLYAECGFDIEAYHELIDEVKGLRREIKRVAWDYELDWDQGHTDAGRKSRNALDIIRKEEAKDRKGRKGKDDEDDEDEDDDELSQIDNDGDGKPDRKLER
ncbi:hypothetical protein EW145_g3116 [Phellinidium pouzarii]|uniref:Calcium uniporter protein, mitochondrial n=1 Tax=Phellinidium pouzarii TaxID=167371 RepID=A0A4S4L886_9AGAM|nr:hypothetical protein EW145_g3116 [Phellinidium pouzarii]